MRSRLEITVRSLPPPALTSVRIRSRPLSAVVEVIALGCLSVGGMVWIVLSGEPESYAAMLIGLVAVLNAVARQRRQTVLTDPALVRAALRVAHALGSESAPGRYVVTGGTAPVLGRAFRDLNRWWTAPGRVGRDPRHEQWLHGAAPAELQAFLEDDWSEPALTEAGGHRPGEGWPVLDRRPDEWPVLPPGQSPS